MKDQNIKHKQLNQKQLVKIFKDVRRLKSDDIRFCFLIGAGASKSSEIPTGWELAKKWYSDLKDDLDKDDLIKWETKVGFIEENVGEFYPQLYTKRYESSPQVGYDEFKNLMEKAEPSIGYVILAQILANEKHKFVITTNFDYLVEDAVRMYTATKSFSAGHETLAGFISSQTERPTIIKVHRDLFLHPLNDNDTTNTLDDQWKKALRPILKNFNLLVLGYGGNDGSLMNYLCEIKVEDRKSIYWCKRKSDTLNSKITSLLKNNDYIVTINDFDELMYSLHTALEYKTFEKFDKPEEHQFVKDAKNRIESLNNKIKKILDSLNKKDPDKGTSSDIKSIFTGDLEYVFKAQSENNTDEEEKIYIDGLKKYPDSPDLMNSYAEFLKNIRKDYDKAEGYYKMALRIEPDDVDILNNYAIFLYKNRKDYDKAEGYFKKALEINLNDADILGNNANFLSDILKDYDKAEEYYKKAIEINPNDANIIGNYAIFLSNIRKDNGKAEEYYKKAFEIKPDDANILGNYAFFLSNIRKDNGKAEEYYKKAFEIKPDDTNNLGNYAHHLILSKNDYATAKIFIDKAFNLKTKKLDILSELWFYRYAHYKEYLIQGEKELEKLIDLGAKSIGWNFQDHVDLAAKNNHPDIKKLQEFADKITK